MLFGSSLLPSVLRFGDKTLALGDIVRHAFTASGLSADEWNNLPPRDREHCLVDAAYEMMEE